MNILQKISKVSVLAITPLIFFGNVTLAQTPTATLSLSPSSNPGTILIGDNLVVDIILNTMGQGVYGVDINSLNFDPSKFQVVDVNPQVTGVQITPGTLMSSTFINIADNTTGTIKFSQLVPPTTTAPKTFTGSGVLAQITFRAISPGTSIMSFDVDQAGTKTAVAGLGGNILNTATGGSYTVSAPDTTSPSVLITSPTNGATVSGSVTLSATASDNVGVVGVQFKLDGTNIGNELTSAPYSGTWNTSGIPNGSHFLSAVARDGVGNTNTSSISITVNNLAEDQTAPTSPGNLDVTSVSSSQVNLSWSASTDPVASGQETTGVDGYYVYRNGSAIPSATVTGTAYSDTNLLPRTSYTYAVRAFDGNDNISNPVSISTTTLPASYNISISTTGTGAGSVTCGGAVCPTTVLQGTTVTFTATPNTDSAFTSWGGACIIISTNTCSLVINGNTAVSAVFTSINQLIPLVSMTSPVSGKSYRENSNVTLAATASDRAGGTISKVEFYEDSTLLATDTTSPYSHVYSRIPLGDYNFSAKAYSSKGYTNTSQTVSITVPTRGNKPPKVRGVTVTEGSIILSWQIPTDPYVTHVEIYRDTVTYPTNDETKRIASTTATSYRDEAVTDGVTYYYSIYTVDDEGVYSDPEHVSYTKPISATEPVVRRSSGGGGRTTRSSGGGSVVGVLVPTVTQARYTSQTVYSPRFTTPLTYATYSPAVKVLQQTLNSLNYTVSVTGAGSRGLETTYFGPATRAALIRFQIANALTPSGIMDTATISKLNALSSQIFLPSITTAPASSTIPIMPILNAGTRFTRNLTIGSRGEDVRNLQRFLNSKGYTVSTSGAGSPGNETTYFGPATRAALIRFQDAYASTILVPSGLTRGTGFFGPATMRVVNGM